MLYSKTQLGTENRKREFEATAKKLGFDKVSEAKLAVAKKFKNSL